MNYPAPLPNIPERSLRQLTYLRIKNSTQEHIIDMHLIPMNFLVRFYVSTCKRTTGIFEIGVAHAVRCHEDVMRSRVAVNGNTFDRQGVHHPDDTIVSHPQKFAIGTGERGQRQS